MQFAIICRTDDRSFELHVAPECMENPTMRRAKLSLKKNDTESRLHRLQQAMQRSASSKGEEVPDKIRVLYRIGRHASTREYNLPTPPETFYKQYDLPLLPLTFEDLENVSEILDTYEWTHNSRLFGCTTSDVFKSYAATTKSQGLPAQSRFHNYFERAYKELIRDCRTEVRVLSGSHTNNDNDENQGPDGHEGSTFHPAQGQPSLVTPDSSVNVAAQTVVSTGPMLSDLVQSGPSMQPQMKTQIGKA